MTTASGLRKSTRYVPKSKRFARSKFDYPWVTKLARPSSSKLQNHTANSLTGGLTLWIAVACYVSLQNLPLSGWLALPFNMLGTWAHELGHCVAAELVGGICKNIVILPFGNGGWASIKSPSEPVADAVIAASGLIGPSAVGGVLLILSRRYGQSNFAMFALAVTLFLSAYFFSDDLFTQAFCGVFGIISLILAASTSTLLSGFVAQFVSVLFCVQTLEGWAYAMISGFHRDGKHHISDTGRIVEILGSTHEFWGAAVMGIAALILLVSFLFSGGER